MIVRLLFFIFGVMLGASAGLILFFIVAGGDGKSLVDMREEAIGTIYLNHSSEEGTALGLDISGVRAYNELESSNYVVLKVENDLDKVSERVN